MLKTFFNIVAQIIIRYETQPTLLNYNYIIILFVHLLAIPEFLGNTLFYYSMNSY